MSGYAISQTIEEKLEASQKILARLSSANKGDPEGEASEVYNYMIGWMSNVNHSPTIVATCLNLAEECIEVMLHGKDEAEKSGSQTTLGLEAAEALALRRPDDLCGPWERVVWDVVTLISEWDPESDGHLDLTEELVDWVLFVLNSPKACPNAHLRLEMIRFIETLPKNKLSDPKLGSRTAQGLINAGGKIEMHMLVPRGDRVSLALPLLNIIQHLKKYGHLQMHAMIALEQLKELQPGAEVRFLANVATLAGKLSIHVVERYKQGGWTDAMAIMMFGRCISVLEIVAGDSPFLPITQMPGMCQMVSSSLITIIDSMLSLSDLCTNRQDSVKILLLDLDVIFRHLIAIKKVFQEDHNVKILEFQVKLNEYNLSLVSMPEPIPENEIKDCPTEFLDAVTQSIMKAPVRLVGSGEKIDESTLLQLLLEESPKDPFTRSALNRNTFLQLPALKLKIQEWISNQ
ncbi:unnamed protein product [Meganyctiphanes norvegica]|uniref:U-box domain-containing protein n=1 Tax=Meganyctiphanes norvegica TaxID=48144 RepID=A0AAV2S9I8_MEGNR